MEIQNRNKENDGDENTEADCDKRETKRDGSDRKI